MLFKNNLHPSCATASAASSQGTSSRNAYHSVQFNMGEADDFNSFHSGNGRNETPRRPQKARQQAPKKPQKSKWILIGAIAAAVVLVFLLVLAVILANTGKDLTYKNNSYLVYADATDKYHVLVNGDEVDFEFEGSVELHEAADRSFAYLVDNGDEGVQIYVLKGKKLEKITPSAVDEVIAFADYEPGVIYRYKEAYRVYSEANGEQQIAKRNKNPKNFLISGDASTVIYSATEDKAETTYDYLYIFEKGTSVKALRNCYPVAISASGDSIYGYMINTSSNTKDLYYIDAKDLENPIKIQNTLGFDDSIAPSLNVKGDEILYYISNGSEYTTMIYRAKKGENYSIGSGIMTFAEVDPNVAVYGKFKEIYLTGVNSLTDPSSYTTYYVNKDYEGEQISKFAGKFSPDGKYFYYINKDYTLRQMDLTDDKRPTKSTNHEDIIDFFITEKGNLYTLDDSQQLRFYKVSTGKTSAISYDATEFSLYNYANNIYFSEEDTEDVNVQVSEEGSEPVKATMAKNTITKVPLFSHPNSKRTYAYYYDSEKGWQLYYTKNGKSFDFISQDCTIFVNGTEITED